MQYNKRFTEGIGYFACFLIAIFLAYSYFTFEAPVPEEDATEIMGIFELTKGFLEYTILFAMFFVSAVVCSLTDRFPFVGIILTFVPLYYTFSLFANKMLVFTPVLLLIFSVFFFVGEIVATAMWGVELAARRRERLENGEEVDPSFSERVDSLRDKLDKLLGFDQVAGYERRRAKRKNKNKRNG